MLKPTSYCHRKKLEPAMVCSECFGACLTQKQFVREVSRFRKLIKKTK